MDMQVDTINLDPSKTLTVVSDGEARTIYPAQFYIEGGEWVALPEMLRKQAD